MYCNYNYGTPCSRCTKYVKSIKVTGDATELAVTIPEMTLCNGKNICVCITQEIPVEVGKDSILKLFVGGDEYAVITPNGNFIYGDQVRSNRMYCFKFAVDTLAFVYKGGWRLCPTKHEYTCIPIERPPVKNKAVKKPLKPKSEIDE